MYITIAEFEKDFLSESQKTQKIFDALTDGSLGQKVANDHRTLGRIAWHIVMTYPEMVGQISLKLSSVAADSPLPKSAAEIKKGYAAVSKELLGIVKRDWTDATLKIESNFYGEMWSRAFMLQVLVYHEIHHRAQMTVLMRQAGLAVPGIYGPSKEEWAPIGMNPPEV